MKKAAKKVGSSQYPCRIKVWAVVCKNGLLHPPETSIDEHVSIIKADCKEMLIYLDNRYYNENCGPHRIIEGIFVMPAKPTRAQKSCTKKVIK